MNFKKGRSDDEIIKVLIDGRTNIFARFSRSQ